MRRAWRLALALPLLAATAAAQGAPDGPRPSAPTGAERPMVEVAPIRCWWRASAGAVAIGETFDVRLTCAVLENDSVQVVPDESRLTIAGVQLPPFEIVGGEHPADTRAGDRRFFQYRYTLRLVNPDEIGQDVGLPRLPITYKVQSRVAANATLAGRDFTYLMPGLSLRVLSLVPEDATDIRDGADVGLERVEALLLRARLADIGGLALLAAGTLLAVLALVAIVNRARPSGARRRRRIPEYRMLGAVEAELSRVAREAAGGWTPEIVSAGHAALRLAGAFAMGRGVSEQPLAPRAPAADGRIAVRAWLPWRPGVAITSATTTADLARALESLPLDAPMPQRTGLQSLCSALATFTDSRYASEGAPDHEALAGALQAGRTEAARLARATRWPWARRLPPTGPWREGAARP